MREAYVLRCALKFWLACFLLLFIGAEILEWLSHLNFVDASGTWLILGGMGLAAASNAAHLPRLGQREATEAEEIPQPGTAQAERTQIEENSPKTAKSNQNVSEKTSESAQASRPSIAEQAREDSVSFEVRFPWR